MPNRIATKTIPQIGGREHVINRYNGDFDRGERMKDSRSHPGGAGLEICENVSLGALSTLGVGGPARYYARARTGGEVEEAVAWAAMRNLDLFVLGGGSNVLIADEGWPGLVLHVAIGGIEARPAGELVEVEAGAGEDWDRLVALTVESGWAGFECLSGIPGLVGATPIQNVGAYGQEVRETIARVEALDLHTRGRVEFTSAECEFGYRESRFKVRERGRYVVLGVTYQLAPGGAPALRYAELRRYFAARGVEDPTLAEVRRAVLEIRRGKSMVLDAGDPDARSAGSFFVNPVLTAEEFAALEAREAPGLRPGERVPGFAAGGGRVKLPAAWLIERAGFEKGYARGNAGISTKHALAIVNRGGATAAEIASLAREIRKRVRERFGVTLTPEPVFVNHG
jgi:UDP-N-acetylmuramate dehydrogenase